MSAGSTTGTQRWRPPPQGEWAYEDYLHLPDNGFRYEVLEGDLVMSPPPSPRHQWAVTSLMVALANYLKSRNMGKVFPALIDVLLSRKTVVEPDIVVLLNDRLSKITETNIDGAPDIAVEVISPSSVGRDRYTKFQIYLKMGVREYWIVDLEERAVEVYVVRGEAYSLFGSFKPGETIESELLPGFVLDAAEVFAL